MPSWKKHFQVVAANSKVTKNLGSRPDYAGPGAYGNKFVSYLPEIYSGAPNRLERYQQYDQMDQDSEVHSSLDTISDFATNTPEKEDVPFEVFFKSKEGPTQAEIDILNTAMRQWCSINSFQQRIWRIFRSTIKYGDQFFIRDPETFELYWVDPYKVQSVIVNPAEGKKPEYYLINDLDINVQTKVGTIPRSQAVNQIQSPSMVKNPAGAAGASTAYNNQAQAASWVGKTKGVSGQGINELAVNAMHVVHVSLSEGLDANWPFGNSILEAIFKVYKQKELLEDALIIYRVQRAPERRVFYVDVGNMPAHKAMAYVERIKNEIHQRRIPNRSGGGTSIMDAAYNPLCLALDTKIPLLDGRTLMLSDLIEEYKQGKENWVYSCDPITGKPVPGNITWAGITRKNAKVIRLTLDNGEQLTVTPDHKIPVFGKGFVEAKDITSDDSLIAFNRKYETVDRSKNENTYEKVWDHESKQWVFTHRMVGEFFRQKNKHQEFVFLPENIDAPKTVIHHADFNRYNNDPRNLQFMNKYDHVMYHSLEKKAYWNNITKQESDRVKNKIRNSLKRYWQNMSDEERDEFCRKVKSIRKQTISRIKHNDPVKWATWRKNVGAARKHSIENNPKLKEKLLKNLGTWQETMPNQPWNGSFKMLQIVADTVKTNKSNRLATVTLLKNNKELLEEIKHCNQPKQGFKFKINVNEITPSRIDRIISDHGYYNWKHFVKNIDSFNHKVVKIEWLDEFQDVGTITVDGKERWHNYHTFAVDCGIYVKNSIMEDYFFPTSAEGRGSKVDTLPGGENLGQIDDLRFFNNKLMRGLRVPSAYLPTGPDDGQQAYTDGRVGTAYIQEFRFSKYVTRLQHLMISNFDLEFKLFLAKRGIRIDSSSFELRFWIPQNFGKYRQMEIDAAQINIFQPMADVKWISKRFLAKRFLGLTDEEILENERMWMEENPKATKGQAIPTESPGLGSVGIRPSSSDLGAPDIDLGEPEGETPGGDTGGEGGETPGGEGGGETAAPEAPAPGETFGA
jgi:hypothetical protein